MGRLRYTVFGAGSVGGVLAYRLGLRNDVAIAARGKHLDAIKFDGLRFRGLDGKEGWVTVEAAADPVICRPPTW